MFTPAIRMYKEKYPDRKLGMLCLPLTESFWKAHPLIDQVFVSYRKYPLHHGILPLYIFERMKLQRIVKKIKRDYGYDKVGYIVPHSWRVFGMAVPVPGVIRRLITLPFEKHEVLKLCKRLNVGYGRRWPVDFKQEIYIPKNYQNEAQKVLRKIIGKKPLCIIHATASSKNKSLTLQEKYHVIIQMKEKYEICLLHEPAYRPDVKALITKDILLSAAIIAKAKLFIGIDSGPAHIAEVLDIPRVIITKTFKSGLLFIPGKKALLENSFDKKKIAVFLSSVWSH